MSKKSTAREQRKALALEKFEANKAAFVTKVNESRQPRLLVDPAQNHSPRVAPHLAQSVAGAEKSPKAIKDGSRFGSRVTWCTTKTDLNGSWSWGEPRAWQPDEWDKVIHPPFQQFAQLTWQEIDKFSSESGHKMHHGHEVGDLIQEAQLRWQALDLEQFDSVFRFRLGGVRRAWGYIVQAHFHMIWWDRDHSIYPTEPN